MIWYRPKLWRDVSSGDLYIRSEIHWHSERGKQMLDRRQSEWTPVQHWFWGFYCRARYSGKTLRTFRDWAANFEEV